MARKLTTKKRQSETVKKGGKRRAPKPKRVKAKVSHARPPEAEPKITKVSVTRTTFDMPQHLRKRARRKAVELDVDLRTLVIDGLEMLLGDEEGAYKRAWTKGYEVGTEEAFGKGYESGYDQGHEKGWEEGHAKGFEEGADEEAYERGQEEGWQRGHEKGFEDGYTKAQEEEE